MLLGMAVLAAAAAPARACTAASTVQQAKNNQGLKSYETARAVASEELDREGIDKERVGVYTTEFGESVTSTPLESAVGTLFLEKFKGQYGVWDEAKNGVITVESWRNLLTGPSADHGPIGTYTVREHLMMHAREFAGSPAAAEPAPAASAPTPAAPAPKPVATPNPAPARFETPALAPPPPVDHAG